MRFAFTVLTSLVLVSQTLAEDERLPFPEENIPEAPPLLPTVVTAGGQRRFISEFPDLKVGWDGNRFFSNYRNWWIVNYPLDHVMVKDGGTFDAAARERAFGPKPLKNWYLRVPGEARPEPPPATRPAPIELDPHPTIVVDQADPTAQYRTVASALKAATAGDVIRVKYGVYREGGLKMTCPNVTLEGERDAKGRLPVITANRLFPKDAWTKSGWKDVWEADTFTKLEGSVSLDGRKLRERNRPEELVGDDYCHSHFSETFTHLREPPRGTKFARVVATTNGFIDVADPKFPKGSVRFARTWVWVEPKARGGKVVWDPRFPLPVAGVVKTKGEFRVGRQNGSGLGATSNNWRIRVNGEFIPAFVYATAESDDHNRAHAHIEYGRNDVIRKFELKEGWNELEFAFDTTCRPENTDFSFPVPKGVERWAVSASEPRDKSKRGDAEWTTYLSEIELSDSIAPGQRLCRTYLRLKDGGDPNGRELDLSAFESVLKVSADKCRVRGLEFRHGSQFQQRALVKVSGAGNVIEFCQVTEPMIKGVSIHLGRGQEAEPIVVRGCRVIAPGNVGIGANAEARDATLTAENQNTTAGRRSRCVLEYNYVSDNNWGGHQALWESGGFKVCNLTGCVLRYNVFEGGAGPGIWMDWQHYNNRIEGNLGLHGWGFLVGIEASPGPNLVCNNIAIDQRPGEVWFRSPFLAWSTGKYWCLHNTVDGRHNAFPAWKGLKGAGAIYLDEGGPDRRTCWRPLEDDRGHIVSYNAVTNIFDKWISAPSRSTRVDGLVRHDFHGLLRFPSDPHTDGACRSLHPCTVTEVELECKDGEMLKR